MKITFVIARMPITFASIFPVLTQPLEGMYVELGFSENISKNCKWKVPSPYLSGIPENLQCSVVGPGNKQYIYDLPIIC